MHKKIFTEKQLNNSICTEIIQKKGLYDKLVINRTQKIKTHC